MRDDYASTNSHYITYTFLFKKAGRMYSVNLGVNGLIIRRPLVEWHVLLSNVFPRVLRIETFLFGEVIDNFFDEVLHKSLLTRGALGLNSCFGSFWIALGIQNFKTFF